jgi:hypothetical protein
MEFAELTRVADLFRARLLTGFLETNGIEARVPDEETIATYDGAATIWSEGVRVEVGGADLERARELLAEWNARARS